jgi:polyisoprenyl-phosphate glycosyltransferase
MEDLVSKNKLISIIVPAFNEEDNIQDAYEEIKKFFQGQDNYKYEIIFLDNHSTDKSFEIIKKIAKIDKSVKGIRFKRNYGFNKSILTGYQLSNGDAAIQMDCDLQDHPKHFQRFIDLWREGFDVVIGLRKKRPESKIKTQVRFLFYKILNAISDEEVKMHGGDFRLVDKTIILKMKKLYDYNPYVRGMISSLSANEISFEYKREERKKGNSKFNLKNLLSFAIDGIANHSIIPLRIASLFGISILIFTLSFITYYMIGAIFFNLDAPRGFITSTSLQLIDIGVTTVFLGILGEYTARIYTQVKMRPITIIEKQINL